MRGTEDIVIHRISACLMKSKRGLSTGSDFHEEAGITRVSDSRPSGFLALLGYMSASAMPRLNPLHGFKAQLRPIKKAHPFRSELF